jgi:hypothetical protein
MKKYSTCTVQYHIQFQGMTETKIMLFHQNAALSMKKLVIVTHFTMKIMRTYLYITCSKKILFVKNILSYCWYSPNSPFFLLLSEHCDNAATNSNSENARSRMLASLPGSVGTRTKEDESSTGRFSATGFHHITVRSRLEHVLKLMNSAFL